MGEGCRSWLEKSWGKNLKGFFEEFPPNIKGLPLIYKNDMLNL
jgi:hypothetical protein